MSKVSSTFCTFLAGSLISIITGIWTGALVQGRHKPLPAGLLPATGAFLLAAGGWMALAMIAEGLRPGEDRLAFYSDHRHRLRWATLCALGGIAGGMAFLWLGWWRAA